MKWVNCSPEHKILQVMITLAYTHPPWSDLNLQNWKPWTMCFKQALLLKKNLARWASGSSIFLQHHLCDLVNQLYLDLFENIVKIVLLNATVLKHLKYWRFVSIWQKSGSVASKVNATCFHIHNFHCKLKFQGALCFLIICGNFLRTHSWAHVHPCI